MTFKTFPEKIKNFDFSVLAVIALICTIGFCVLYSAAGGNFEPWAAKQMLRALIGFMLLTVIALTDIRFIRSLSYPFYGVTLLLLIYVEFSGHIGKGGQRWIDLYLIKLQPSELMKIALVMALANYFHTIEPHEIRKLKTYIFPVILIALPSLLVLRQPDLGTMLLFAATGAAMIFIVGIRYWKALIALALGLISIPIIWSHMHDYQKNRVLTFLNPESDPLGKGYQVIQSKIAIGSGGFWGKGFLQGTQNQLSFLPEKQTDCIFATFCEEFGVFGGMILIALYTFLIVYGYRVTFENKNLYGRLLSIGLTTLFFLYVFVNMAMVMELLPVVGVPLPFMSWGGTSMLSLMMGFGLLMSASIHRSLRFGYHY